MIITGAVLLSVLLFPHTIIRTILGLPFLLFFPGYTLVSALFPDEQALDKVERIALSFGLSIALTPLVGLLLNYIWEISLNPILLSLSTLIFALSALAHFRRMAIPREERFDINIRMNMPDWSEYDTVDKLLAAGTVLLLISSAVLAAYIIVTPRTGERFTEYYILGPYGMADDYPTELQVNRSGHVIVGVTNREHRAMEYLMVVRAALMVEQIFEDTGEDMVEDDSGEGMDTGVNIYFDFEDMVVRDMPEDYNITLSPSITYAIDITLDHEETFSRHLNFSFEESGLYMVQFLLFKPEEFSPHGIDPYRNLHLWVTVTEEG